MSLILKLLVVFNHLGPSEQVLPYKVYTYFALLVLQFYSKNKYTTSTAFELDLKIKNKTEIFYSIFIKGKIVGRRYKV